MQVDVRVLATTNRDLRAEVAAGRFREDLFYRLAVCRWTCRRCASGARTCPNWSSTFWQLLGRSGCTAKPAALEPGAQDLLVDYHWPGNVRELENIITRASVLDADRPIGGRRAAALADRSAGATGAADGRRRCRSALSLDDMERKLIESTLDRFGGHRARRPRRWASACARFPAS